MKIKFIQSDYTACAYYRILVPHRHILAAGLAESSVHFLSDPAYWDGKEDITVIARQYLPMAFKAIKDKRARGIWVVGDLDDDIESTPTGNPAWKAYSPAMIRAEEERKRKNGELGHDEHVLNTRKWLYTFFRCCDAVTVPTEVLAARMRKHNRRVYVLPNYINDMVLRCPSKPYESKQKFRILWTGSSSHAVDMGPFYAAIQRILDEFSHVVYVQVGTGIPGEDKLPKGRVEIYPATQWTGAYTACDQYYALLSKLPAQVAVCPLADNRFNEAKSWLKAIEYGAFGYSPILQDSPPYRALLGAGLDGRTVPFVRRNSEACWYTALRDAVTDPGQVLRIAKEFQTFVWDTMRMSQHILEYSETYQRILELPRNTWFPDRFPEAVNVGRK